MRDLIYIILLFFLTIFVLCLFILQLTFYSLWSDQPRTDVQELTNEFREAFRWNP